MSNTNSDVKAGSSQGNRSNDRGQHHKRPNANAPLAQSKMNTQSLPIRSYLDQTVRVKCLGGRELKGILRGYDELVNLVLDDCDEFLRGKF